MASSLDNILSGLPDDTPPRDLSLVGGDSPLVDLNDLPDQTPVKLREQWRGAKESPDDVAATRALSKATGWPEVTVKNNKPDAQLFAQEPDWRTLEATSPKTAVKLASDIRLFEVAKDDTENLSALELVTNKLGRGALALLSYGPVMAEATAGVGQAGSDVLSEYVTRPLAKLGILPEDLGARMAAQFAAERKYYGDAARFATEGDGATEQSIYQGLQSLGLNLTTLPFALVTQSARVPLAIMTAVTGGQSYGQARDKGLSVEGSLLHGAEQATAEYVTERLPAGAFIENLPRGYARAALEFLKKDVFGEQIATAWQDLNEWTNLNPERTLADYMAERPEQAYRTLVATLVGGGGALAIAKGADLAAGFAEARAKKAEAVKEVLTEFDDLAAKSKTRERDPQAFGGFVRSLDPEAEVVVDARQFAEVLKQSGVDTSQLMLAMPSVREQLPQALATGGDVFIPMHEYAENIAGTDIAKPLIEHLRMDAEDVSAFEATVYKQRTAEMQQDVTKLQQQMEEVTAKRAADKVWQESSQRVHDSLLEDVRATGKFTDNAARAQIAPLHSFLTVTADALGITPEQMYERYAIKHELAAKKGERTLGQKADEKTVLKQDADRAQVSFGMDITKSPSIVGLYEKADFTSLLHEHAHFFFEVYRDIATRTQDRMLSGQAVLPGEQRILDDMNNLLGFVGAKSLEEWNAKTFEQRRVGHEKVAEAFEVYLSEGKAPSLELQPLFQRFRAWLLETYKQLRGYLSPAKINPEIRAVFDRMLASEEQIKLAQTVRNMEPIFTTKPEGVSDEDWQAYQELSEQAKSDATDTLQARSIRDMRWLAGHRARTIKAMQKEAKGKRGEVQSEVEAEVRKTPLYAALRWLKTGEMTSAAGEDIRAGKGYRLRTADLEAMYPEKATDRPDLTRLKGLTAKEGLHPDLVAEMFGFRSGDHLVRELLAAEPVESVIEGMTDQRMLEQYADLSSREAIERAADEAVHNDARLRFVATHYKMLIKAEGSVRIIAKAAKDTAIRLLGARPVKEVKPARYAAAAAKASRAAQQAAAKGDMQGAAVAARDQLVNTALVREAADATKEIDKALASFKKVFGPDSKLAKGRDMDMVNAARAILAAHGIGKMDRPASHLEKLKSYAPDVYDGLAPVLLNALDGASNYSDMSLDAFRALRDTVDVLMHQAVRSRQMLINGKLVDRDQVMDTLRAKIAAGNFKLKERPGIAADVTEADKRTHDLRGLAALRRRVEFMVDNLDSGDISGPFRMAIFEKMKAAALAYRAAKARAYEALVKGFAGTLGTLDSGAIDAPEIGYTFTNGKRTLLHALMHTGNPSNKRKLLLGRGWATETPEGTLDTTRWDAFLARMYREGKITKADWRAVQAVWDLHESIKPDLQKAYKDIYGYYFEEVTAEPVQTPFGTYKGGYIPAFADPLASSEVEGKQSKSVLEEDITNYTFPTPGFVKSRVEYNRPLALDIGLLQAHIDKALKFAYIRPHTQDVARLIESKEFRALIDPVDPVAVEAVFKPWLQRADKQIIEQPMTFKGGAMIARGLRAIRRRTAMQIMFANAVNSLLNVTNFGMVAAKLSNLKDAKVTKGDVRRSVWQLLSDYKGASEFIASKDPTMAERGEHNLFDVMEDLDTLLRDVNRYEKVQKYVTRHTYFLQRFTQNPIDRVVWLMTYKAALRADPDEARAIRLASSAVRMTQGSMFAEDISHIEAGNAAARVLLMFYGFFNVQEQLTTTEVGKIARERGWKGGAGRITSTLFLSFVLVSFLSEALSDIADGAADDDDDGYLDEVLNWLFVGIFKGLAAWLPYLGQFATAGVNALDDKPYNDRVSLSPALTMGESAVGVVLAGKRLSEGKDLTRRNVKDTLNTVGMVTGLPVGALGKPVGYLMDVDKGKAQPENAADYARGLVTGRSPQK